MPVEAGETAAERTEHILACQQPTDEYLGTSEDFRIRAATGGGGSIGSTIAMIRLFFLPEGEETLEKLDEIYPAL